MKVLLGFAIYLYPDVSCPFFSLALGAGSMVGGGGGGVKDCLF